jgi:hypothetical protein
VNADAKLVSLSDEYLRFAQKKSQNAIFFTISKDGSNHLSVKLLHLIENVQLGCICLCAEQSSKQSSEIEADSNLMFERQRFDYSAGFGSHMF